MRTVEASENLKPLIKKIAIGKDKGLVSQLIQKSGQAGIVCYTPNDRTKRFGSQAMFDKWESQGREIHWLLGKGDDLAGILWYGKKEFPLEDLDLAEMPEETVAIRLYDGYTGHGLARPAMLQSLKLHVKDTQERGEPVKGIWLQTDTDNKAALAVYGKFGYREVSRDGARVTMVLPAEDVLAKCSGKL